MYYYNQQETDNENNYNVNNNNNNAQYPPLYMDNTSFDELPTQFLDNQQLGANGYSLFDPTWDYYNFQQTQTFDPQEAILFSDPNFLRQHQLLQEEQKEMHTRFEHKEPEKTKETKNIPPLNITTNTNTSTATTTTPTVNTATVTTPPTSAEEGKKQQQQQKRSNRRQQVFGKSSSVQDDEKIDHQRRFNELQARFRVNYARKPQQHQSSQNKSKRPSLPTKQLSSSSDDASVTSQKTAPPTKIELPTSTFSPGPSILTTPPIPGGVIMNSPTIKKTEEFSVTKEYLSSSFPSRTMPIQIQRVSRANNSSHYDAESYQKQLDNQLDKVDFNDITVSELKEMLRQRGKPATGKKAILLQRLQEERELAKGGRRIMNRHSQPLPLSYNDIPQQQRPNSFQGSSSSSPIDAYLPPASPGGQLNRSIANMHIGSPPTTSRRYSPYSPRLGTSPKHSYFEYSSSVPLTSGNLSPNNVSPPVQQPTNNGGGGGGMMLASSYSASRLTPGRYYNNTKSYKPFTSSALATPDREEDINPFDAYYAGGVDPPIKEEESFTETSNTDWSDPNRGEQPIYSDEIVWSNEQIMALLNSQQQAAAQNFKLDDSGFNPNFYQQH